jgi:hypothetical protein
MSRFSPLPRPGLPGAAGLASAAAFAPLPLPLPFAVAVLAALAVLAAAFGSSDFVEFFEAADLALAAVVLDAVLFVPVVFDAVLPFFSAITPLP